MENQKSFENLPNAVDLLGQKLEKLETLIKSYRDTQSSSNPEKLLTVAQAAKFLCLTTPTIYSKVSRGELPYMKRGKRLYFSNTELMDYLKEGRKKSNEQIEVEAHKYLSVLKK